MRVEAVTSAQNPKIKTLLALQEKARLRKEMGLFVVEGRRELEHCLEGGFEIDTVFICPEIYGLGLASEGSGPSESRATLGNVRGRGPSEMGGAERSEAFSGTVPATDGNNAKSGRIHVADISGYDLPTAMVRVDCSKGTYIRALARDLGEALDSGAFLSSLRRTRNGGIAVEDSLSLDDTAALFKF